MPAVQFCTESGPLFWSNYASCASLGLSPVCSLISKNRQSGGAVLYTNVCPSEGTCYGATRSESEIEIFGLCYTHRGTQQPRYRADASRAPCLRSELASDPA